MTKTRLWTRDFIIVSAVNFLMVTVFYLLIVVMGLYATREFQASASEAGLVAGVFIVGVLTGRLFIGQSMARLGRKRCMLAGLLLAAVACLFYMVNLGILFLIATRFLHGFAVGIAATAVATVVAYLIPVSRSGEGIGYFGMSASLATAIGPFIGIYMMLHTEFWMILVLCTVLSMVCFLVGLSLHVPELTKDQVAKAPTGFSFARLLEPSVVPICCVILLVGIFYSSVLSFLNVYAAERSLSQAASLFFVVYAVTLLISRPICGRLLDRRGANTVMYPSFVLMAAGMATIGLADTGIHLLVAALLLGLGFGNMQSSAQAIVIKSVAPERLALATSTFFIFVDSGLGFGPYLLGLIVPFTGYANLYQLLACLTLASVAIYHLVYGRKERALRRLQNG